MLLLLNLLGGDMLEGLDLILRLIELHLFLLLGLVFVLFRLQLSKGPPLGFSFFRYVLCDMLVESVRKAEFCIAAEIVSADCFFSWPLFENGRKGFVLSG